MIHAFLLIGQSNMAGRGPLDQAVWKENPRVQMWRDGAWQLAKEPISIDRTFAGASLGPTFADAVSHQYDVDVGLIPCADGGAKLDWWQPGTPLFRYAVEAARAAKRKNAKLCGILWHQGESDSGEEILTKTYPARFLTMLDAITAELEAEDVPVLVGELGDYLKEYYETPLYQAVNAQLRSLPALRREIGFVPAADLPDLGDRLHFSTPALRALGERYADAYIRKAREIGFMIP